MNSRSGYVKGSHKRPYVTLSNQPVDVYLGKSKSKARSHSAGQSVNGALTGEQGSKLSELELAKKVVANSWFFVTRFLPDCDTKFRSYVKKSLVSSLKSFKKLILTVP